MRSSILFRPMPTVPSALPSGLSREEINKYYAIDFLESGGLDQRLVEQQAAGTVVEHDGRYTLTSRGEVVNRVPDMPHICMQRPTDFWPTKSPSVTMNSTRAPGIAARRILEATRDLGPRDEGCPAADGSGPQAITQWAPNGPKPKRFCATQRLEAIGVETGHAYVRGVRRHVAVGRRHRE
jgi:hypothetical protein